MWDFVPEGAGLDEKQTRARLIEDDLNEMYELDSTGFSENWKNRHKKK